MTEKNCLTDEDIENYARGTLTDKEQEIIEGHLPKCKSCFRRVIAALKGEDPDNKEEEDTIIL